MVRGIANPLKLGDMKLDATHFVIGQHWKNHFTRKLAEAGLTATTGVEVQQLRKWINEPKPMGLPKEAENLVILLYALQTNQSFFMHGAPFTDPNLSNLLDRCILKPVDLPPEEQWAAAIERAGAILGLAISPLRNSSNVATLTSAAKRRAGELRAACQMYCQAANGSKKLADRWKPPTASRQRPRHCNWSKGCMRPPKAIVVRAGDGTGCDQRVGDEERLAKAERLAATLEGTNWEIFEGIDRFNDERTAAASEVLGAVEEALRCDEHVKPLAVVLKEAQSKAVRLLTAQQAPKPVSRSKPTPPLPPGWKVVDQGNGEFRSVAEAKAKLDDLSGQLTGNGRRIIVTMSWQIDEEKR